MSKLGTLIRAGLKSNFGLALLWHRLFKEKKDRWLVPLIGLSFISILPLFYGLVHLIQNAYLVLKPMNQERAILAPGILAGQLVILIFGIYYVISAFYFSRDLEMLIPLPVRPFEVMVSKFAIIMVNEYLTVAAIVLPVVITFGILSNGGLSYWVNATLVYLTLPVIPLTIVSVFVVAMMRFINVSRKKDIFILVGSIALLVAVFGIQFLANRAGNKNINAQDLAAFLTSPNSLLNRIGAWFPPSVWASKAIAGGFSGEGLKNLAILLGTSLLLFGAMIGLAELLFYKGVIGLSETSVRKRMLTRDEMSRQVSSGRRAVAAIFTREWRIMNRTPVFLLNGILVVVMLPAFFILMAKTGSGKLGSDLSKIVESGNSLFIILFIALFMIICGSINGTSSSTFSREGAQFWISRVIPVAPREQVAAKFLHSYLITMVGVAAALVVMVVVFPLKAAHLAVAAGLAIVMSILLTVVGMIIDLARPLLDWTNPQKAIKQNLNVLLAMFADIGILTAAYFGVKALIKAGVAGNVIISMLFAILAILAALSYLLLLNFADRRYREIET